MDGFKELIIRIAKTTDNEYLLDCENGSAILIGPDNIYSEIYKYLGERIESKDNEESEKTIPIVRVVFKHFSDLILHMSDYTNATKLCSDYSFSLSDISKIKKELINPRDFPITEWEG